MAYANTPRAIRTARRALPRLTDNQGHACAICQYGGRADRLFVDGDRFICYDDNVLLGDAGDDPARLRAAARYLEAQ